MEGVAMLKVYASSLMIVAIGVVIFIGVYSLTHVKSRLITIWNRTEEQVKIKYQDAGGFQRSFTLAAGDRMQKMIGGKESVNLTITGYYITMRQSEKVSTGETYIINPEIAYVKIHNSSTTKSITRLSYAETAGKLPQLFFDGTIRPGETKAFTGYNNYTLLPFLKEDREYTLYFHFAEETEDHTGFPFTTPAIGNEKTINIYP